MRSEVREGQFLPEEEAAARLLSPAYLRALSALDTSGARCLVLRVPVATTEPIKDLDLLIDQASLPTAAEALAAAGFLPKTSPLGLPSKVVLSTYDGGRFHSLDVHTSIVSGGLTYLETKSVLRRRVVRAGCPLPCIEDSLVHLVLHPLLSRREVGGKYVERIRQMAALPFDREYLSSQLSRFRLGDVFWRALDKILGSQFGPSPETLWRQANRRLLLRSPRNLLQRSRYRLAGVARIRRRAALVAFVGVDGVGKSALVSALAERLAGGGLRTVNIYLGCWGRYQTRIRWVGNFSPRDRPPEGETGMAALMRILRNLVKFGIFYGGILFEQAVRYRRGVVRTSAHVILSDRYLYDLEIPFSRRYVLAGRWLRRRIYRLFPTPDLIFHLQALPHEISARKPELVEEQMVRFDQIYEEVLVGRPVVQLQVRGSPDELAREIVEGYWREIVTACWKHAPRSVLPRGARGRKNHLRYSAPGSLESK